jgi:DNA primase
MIADEVKAEIRSKADIVEVIGQHVQLKKAGKNYKGLCPFHGEKTPSFNVQRDKGFFHCFGCGKHGDVFTFVMELEGKSFVEAAEQLGARFGVEVPKIAESPELARARGERTAMLDANRLAATFFREILHDDKRGAAGRAYLDKRGVGTDVADKFQLGYAPPDWHLLADHLKQKRVDLEIATKLGLVARQPRAGGYYDRFRDRLVCPVVVPGGEIAGFSARVIGQPPKSPDGSEPPKYINSPESPVYKKSKLLFGLAQAREGMQQTGRAVLVEGNFDVITLHQAGFTEVVAPLGTALTLEQLQTLRRLADRVVLLYDGDRAGYKATMSALELGLESEINVYVARRPGHAGSGGAGLFADGDDPDSLVAAGKAAQLRQAVDRAKEGLEFFCFEVWDKAPNAEARARALDHAARLIAKVAQPTRRDLLVQTIANAFAIDPGVVVRAVARASGPTAAPAEARPKVAEPVVFDELEVIALLADHPDLIASPEADKVSSLLTSGALRDMYSAARGGRSLSDLAPESLPPQAAKHVLSGKYADAKDPRGQLLAMTGQLGIRKTKLEARALQRSLVDAQRKGDRELARQLAQQISSNRNQAD